MEVEISFNAFGDPIYRAIVRRLAEPTVLVLEHPGLTTTTAKERVEVIVIVDQLLTRREAIVLLEAVIDEINQAPNFKEESI